MKLHILSVLLELHGVPKKVFLTDDNIDWLVKEFYKIVKFTSEQNFYLQLPILLMFH